MNATSPIRHLSCSPERHNHILRIFARWSHAKQKSQQVGRSNADLGTVSQKRFVSQKEKSLPTTKEICYLKQNNTLEISSRHASPNFNTDERSPTNLNTEYLNPVQHSFFVGFSGISISGPLNELLQFKHRYGANRRNGGITGVPHRFSSPRVETVETPVEREVNFKDPGRN